MCGTNDVISIAAMYVTLPRHMTTRHPQRSQRLVAIGAAMYVVPIAREPIHAVEKQLGISQAQGKKPNTIISAWLHAAKR